MKLVVVVVVRGSVIVKVEVAVDVAVAVVVEWKMMRKNVDFQHVDVVVVSGVMVLLQCSFLWGFSCQLEWI